MADFPVAALIEKDMFGNAACGFGQPNLNRSAHVNSQKFSTRPDVCCALRSARRPPARRVQRNCSNLRRSHRRHIDRSDCLMDNLIIGM